MKHLFITLLLCSPAFAAHGDIDGTTDFPPEPTQWLVVAFPDNFQADPLSQGVFDAFRTNPTLIELRNRSAVRTYTASHADWQHRWLPKLSPNYPIVILMHGNKVVYKRSAASGAQVIADLKSPQLIGQWRPRPWRPNCPDDNCPRPPDDYPDDNYPDRPGPSNPLRPISPPLIPDTVPQPVAPVTPPPVVPSQPTVDTKAFDDLSKRVDDLEKKVDGVVTSITNIDKSVQSLTIAVNQSAENKLTAEAIAAAVAKAIPEQKPPIINIDTKDIAAELAKRNQLTVNFLDGDGNVALATPVKDGQINIPAQRATWLRLDGRTEEQARPLGTPLKFQTETRQATPEGAK